MKLSLTYISVGPRDSDVIGSACDALGWLDADLEVTCADSGELDSDERMFLDVLSSVRSSDLVVMKIHGDPDYFSKFPRVMTVVKGFRIPVLLECQYGDIRGFYRGLFPYGDDVYDLATRYVRLSGEKNAVSFLLWFCRQFGGMDIRFPQPELPLSQGLYRPGKRKVDEKTYLRSLPPDRPTIGIMFNQTYWKLGDLDHINALIEDLESKGANTVPVFFLSAEDPETDSLGVAKTIARYMTFHRKTAVDCIIMASGFSQTSMGGMVGEDGRSHNYFEKLDVPVLQASYIMRSPEEWEDDPEGMTSSEISISVIQPEFDGQIDAGPLGFRVTNRDGGRRFGFVRDRVGRISDLALAWAALRRKPRSEVRIAVMLNTYPPSNGSLGSAAGLDTFESLRRLMSALSRSGYDVGRVPSRSGEIVDSLMAGITNDLSWVPSGEIPDRAADMVDKATYSGWLRQLPDGVRMAVCGDWGDPPGNITTYNCRIAIPGFRSGNMFIGIEPGRGGNSLSEALYHDRGTSPPHQYIAYYRWLREVFGADCIVHMGTHGTLEWLPGKTNALSSGCFPDAVLGAVPHIYPYIINDPGEGMAAKRRTASVLVDYSCPSMCRSGLYGDLLDLENLLQTLMNSESTMQTGKAGDTVGEIRSAIGRLGMWKELGLVKDADCAAIEERAGLIYDYVCQLKDGMVKDGLHVLGAVPSGKRMDNAVRMLTLHRNGDVPSLSEAVAASMGYDLAALEADRSARTDGELNGEVLDRVEEAAAETARLFRAADFDTEECLGIAGECPELRKVAEFVCGSLHPWIQRTSDEMSNLVAAIGGRFVPPGPSGSPTRGNAHLLPTGRNCYSMDPAAVPTAESWTTGGANAEAAVRRFVDETGRFPENVGIVIWATDAMKTGGDDISYILRLLGVRPLWDSRGGPVTGLEVIPLQELGRPRIDVTVRISGIFRDSFPHLLDLLDDAFSMVAGLDESEEENLIRRHLAEDIREHIRSGLSEEESRARSMVRLFGDPPNRYGGGTGTVVGSCGWNSIGDLGKAYAALGSHAYGRTAKGERMEAEFVRRLSVMDLTVKNMCDREFDILDSENVFDILGGLNASVRAFGGRKPKTFVSDTWNADGVRIRSLEEETAYLFRTRVANPKWIAGLREHGFSGATEVSKLTDCMLGWSATSDNIEDWMFAAVADMVVFDERNSSWMTEVNPYAMKDVLENMIEAVDRGLWEPPEGTRERLVDAYVECEGVLEEESAS